MTTSIVGFIGVVLRVSGVNVHSVMMLHDAAFKCAVTYGIMLMGEMTRHQQMIYIIRCVYQSGAAVSSVQYRERL